MVLKELCALRGVSGAEAPVRDYILEKVRKTADHVCVDRMGNVIAFKRGAGAGPRRHIAFAAHMDEVGLIVVGINDNGLLSYETIGGIDSRVLVSKCVLVGENAVPGVIGAKAIHLQSAEERRRVLGHGDLYIDIGAKDKKAAEELVSPGDYVSFDSEWMEFGEGLVKSKALDDRVGCMTMLSLLEEEYPCDLTCVFTVQEETGLRGAKTAACAVNADAVIVLEGTTSNDLGDVEDHLKVCRVGAGAVISFMDKASIGARRLFEALKSTAREGNISWQLKKYVSGGNDTGALQTNAGARATGVISVPCRYIHSHSSVASFADIEAQYLLAHRFLSQGGEF